MTVINRSRRHFLVGTGGTLLALPVLPSLYPTEALAQAAASQRYFAHVLSWHGGAYQSLMFPQPATPAETMNYAGFQIRRTPLAAAISGSTATLTPILSGPSSVMTAALVAKMNVINGMDVPFYISHNSAMALGNWADADGGDAAVQTAGRRMTIDQIMAWSPSFYKNPGNVQERDIVIGNSRPSSWTWSNPQARSGTFQNTGTTANSNVALFDKLFKTTTTPAGTGARAPIADQMLASYKNLRDGNARLSAADKQRLSDHMDRIAELQRKLQATVASGPPARPNTDNSALRNSAGFGITPSKHVQNETLWNDIVVAAFASGLSAVHVRTSDQTFSTYGGDWHQDIAHTMNANANSENLMATSFQTQFAGEVLDLASKMNAVSNGVGGTLLDNALVAWSHESGAVTHIPQNVPIITFGGAGGTVRTGNYLDYRNLNKLISYPSIDAGQTRCHGLLMHQFIGNALQAMGIPASEYEKPAVNGGYPDFNYSNVLNWFRYNGTEDPYPAAVWAATGQPLPWFKV